MATHYNHLTTKIQLGSNEANDFLFGVLSILNDPTTEYQFSETPEMKLRAMDLAFDVLLSELSVHSLLHVEIQQNGPSEGNSLWIHGDKNPDFELLAAAIQDVLGKYNLDTVVSFEFSTTASRPLLNVNSGGAFVISKDTIESINTTQWRMQKEQELRHEMAANQDPSLS